jgi:hypothetical protein
VRAIATANSVTRVVERVIADVQCAMRDWTTFGACVVVRSEVLDSSHDSIYQPKTIMTVLCLVSAG